MGFFQVFLRDFLNRPSDDQASLIRFFGFGDDVEVDMRNDLGDHPSTKDYKYRRYRFPYLVSDRPVILMGRGTLAGRDAEGG